MGKRSSASTVNLNKSVSSSASSTSLNRKSSRGNLNGRSLSQSPKKKKTQPSLRSNFQAQSSTSPTPTTGHNHHTIIDSLTSGTPLFPNEKMELTPAGDHVVVELTEKEKKKQTFIVRTIWTLFMIAGFFVVLAAGHLWLIAFVGLIQVLTFKEVINLAAEPSKDGDVPFSRSLNWYFLATTIYFLEGESVIHYFKHIVLVDTYLLPLATHHRFLSYCLYIIGFVFFVGTLDKNHFKFQFSQFCMTHMTLLFTVVQAHFIVNNIFSGLFWFFIPATLVITNDIFAYICGITFGRTQLIKISPKKTVEGFVGAWVCTIIMGVALSWGLSKVQYFICPLDDWGTNVFSGLSCTPNPVFISQAYPVAEEFGWIVGGRDIIYFKPVHFHVMVLATFASLIAPFGGFFASGLKRAFKVKDFGDTIPGHGGITDRVDCQFLMGFFAYLYHESFVSTHGFTINTVLRSIVFNFSYADQVEIINNVLGFLENQGAIEPGIRIALKKVL
ncbi:phosphatidate cytidylyltransferase [Nadsonia fulvescens var. elongata DSM 6958]|uniref:Phosphatidate cytidylyltransferase n=1 Tax=Nadsonia fulvescens var. elongata DSM 6958 TaxID=857566 RepID=A0A1E3PCC6_9ASCO|nr:phosphatidate cytidylyltransferase [Nadsonia fulvescens var. elongata DSM 6958]